MYAKSMKHMQLTSVQDQASLHSSLSNRRSWKADCDYSSIGCNNRDTHLHKAALYRETVILLIRGLG